MVRYLIETIEYPVSKNVIVTYLVCKDTKTSQQCFLFSSFGENKLYKHEKTTINNKSISELTNDDYISMVAVEIKVKDDNGNTVLLSSKHDANEFRNTDAFKKLDCDARHIIFRYAEYDRKLDTQQKMENVLRQRTKMAMIDKKRSGKIINYKREDDIVDDLIQNTTKALLGNKLSPTQKQKLIQAMKQLVIKVESH